MGVQAVRKQVIVRIVRANDEPQTIECWAIVRETEEGVDFEFDKTIVLGNGDTLVSVETK